MADPTGEADKGTLRLDFDRRLLLQFRGSAITSDAGLVAFQMAEVGAPRRREKEIGNVESLLSSLAAQEMRAGPSGSDCRIRVQTATSRSRITAGVVSDLQPNQRTDTVTDTQTAPPLPGAAGACRAVNQLPKSVGAGNPHATFCGNRGRATAPGDPVGGGEIPLRYSTGAATDVRRHPIADRLVVGTVRAGMRA
jgi:hypothetical protein